MRRDKAADILPKRLVYLTNDTNSVRHANALITSKLPPFLRQLASSSRSDCFARRADRQCAIALSDRGSRIGHGDFVARFRRNFADVAADCSIARGKVYRDRAGFAGYW